MTRREDRISALLKRDESLIDLLVSLSPAFERLRNRAMRKVMSRLVTVEQAATMAGIDPDTLVARIDAHLRGEASTEASAALAEEPGESAAGAAPPPELARIPAERRVEIDVRAQLRAGEEPFSQIMAARREVPEGGALAVRAIFDPVPLHEVMRRQGLAHHTERLADDDWRVWFYPSGEVAAADDRPTRSPRDSAGQTAGGSADGKAHEEADVVVLDVRGLEPPEPMMRTLAALETLPAGGTLLQINVRVPQFLLPILEERGFHHEIREQEPGLVRLFIRRMADSAAPTTETDR